MKHTDQNKLCDILKFLSFLQSKSVNNVCKLLQLLEDYVLGPLRRGFAPGPHWGLPSPDPLGYSPPKWKFWAPPLHFSNPNPNVNPIVISIHPNVCEQEPAWGRWKFVKRRVWSLAGTRGSGCRTGCVSGRRARRTATAVCASTCATGRHTSASTAGTARRARRSATAAYDTRTVTESGRRRPSTDINTSSAANASEMSDVWYSRSTAANRARLS